MDSPGRREQDHQLERCLRDDPLIDRILSDPETFRPQILVQPLLISANRADTQSGGGSDQPRTYRVGCDAHRYFYPASAIKLCAAIAALKKVVYGDAHICIAIEWNRMECGDERDSCIVNRHRECAGLWH